ncbi:MAG: SDR family NAD(P)-dependent oxidoreductase [Crocinitomix sp.]|nr:SDR family NAD(P)-dependent oxidoreductase [Crocinitomix sp.]
MKKIVIIGGSRGIGRALALQLSANHRVLVLARSVDKLKELQEISLGNNLMIGAVDLTAPNLREYLTTLITSYFPEVDVLINNAGYLVNKPFLELTEADIKDSFATNVFGLIQSCQAAVPLMEKKGGHIVNIGSMGGFQGSSKFPGLSVYSSSKSAVAGFSECLAEELKDKNIQVNCLALGAAQTEMLEEAFPGYEAPVTANEMAKFIADFSLNANGWINGKVIPVSLSTP